MPRKPVSLETTSLLLNLVQRTGINDDLLKRLCEEGQLEDVFRTPFVPDRRELRSLLGRPLFSSFDMGVQALEGKVPLKTQMQLLGVKKGFGIPTKILHTKLRRRPSFVMRVYHAVANDPSLSTQANIRLAMVSDRCGVTDLGFILAACRTHERLIKEGIQYLVASQLVIMPRLDTEKDRIPVLEVSTAKKPFTMMTMSMQEIAKLNPKVTGYAAKVDAMP